MRSDGSAFAASISRSIRLARSSRLTERTKSLVAVGAVGELLRRRRQHRRVEPRVALQPVGDVAGDREDLARLAERDPVEPLHRAAASRGPPATRRTGRTRCGRSRRPAGTGARATRPCSGAGCSRTGNFVAITSSIGRPSASVRSSSRQRNAWSSTRVPGYHLYGIVDELGLVPAQRGARRRADRPSTSAPAVHERHLRPADRDPHSRCSSRSSRAMRSSRSSISFSDGVVERALVGQRPARRTSA